MLTKSKFFLSSVFFLGILTVTACSSDQQTQTADQPLGEPPAEETVAPPPTVDSPDDIVALGLYETQELLGLTEEQSNCFVNKVVEGSGLSVEELYSKFQSGELAGQALADPTKIAVYAEECNIGIEQLIPSAGR